MNTVNPTQTPTSSPANPGNQPQPCLDTTHVPSTCPETNAVAVSSVLRDSISEAERAEELARQERERTAMRLPVGLD